MFTAVYILDPGPHTQCAYIIRTDVTQLVRMIQTQKWEGKCDLKPVLNSNFFKKLKQLELTICIMSFTMQKHQFISIV